MKDNKTLIFYSLASAGMGHATRAIPILKRMQVDFEVHIFCSGNAYRWLKNQFQNVHLNHPIKGGTIDGKISMKMIILKVLVSIPKTFFFIFYYALLILLKKPNAIVSDFEGHMIYAALLVRPFKKVPIISCDHWTTMRMSKIPFKLSASELESLKVWQKTTGLVTPFADQFLVHGTMKTKLNNDKAMYTPVPVRDSFLAARKSQKCDGPIVVSMGHLTSDKLVSELKSIPHNFHVYCERNPSTDKNVEFKSFDEKTFIEAIQRCPFAIVSANSSAIDVLAAGKPFLYIPFPGQFEQFFCGKIFEYLEVAMLETKIDSIIVDKMFEQQKHFHENALKIDIFNNDKLYQIIKKSINKTVNPKG